MEGYLHRFFFWSKKETKETLIRSTHVDFNTACMCIFDKIRMQFLFWLVYSKTENMHKKEMMATMTAIHILLELWIVAAFCHPAANAYAEWRAMDTGCSRLKH